MTVNSSRSSNLIHQGADAGGFGAGGSGGSTMMRSASYAILADTLNYSPQSIVVTGGAPPHPHDEHQEQDQDIVTTVTNVIGARVSALLPSTVSQNYQHPNQICGTSLFLESGMNEEELNTFRSLIYSSSEEEESSSPEDRSTRRRRQEEEEWNNHEQQTLLLCPPHNQDGRNVHFIPLERMLAMPSCTDLIELDSAPTSEEDNNVWNHTLLHHSVNAHNSFQLTPKSALTTTMQEGSSVSRTRNNTSLSAPSTPQGTSSMLSLSSVSCSSSGSAEYFFDPDELDYVINHHHD